MDYATTLFGPDALFFNDKFAEVLSPLVEVDEEHRSSIDQMLQELDCLSDRPSSNDKIAALLASFLMQAQRLKVRIERKARGTMVIGFPHREVYWRIRSSVGYKIAEKLRKALVKHGWMKLQFGATINLYDGSGNCTGYLIADFVTEKANGLTYQSTEFLYPASSSAINKVISDKTVCDRMKALWAIWKETPLTFAGRRMFTAARRFNDTSLTRGGRIYGPWTTMKQVDRLKCTINGEPVAEVDVRGMNLTMVASISHDIPFNPNFSDPYFVEGVPRNEVKAVVNSAIGGGTSRQTTPTKLIKDAGISQERLTLIRGPIMDQLPCLKSLTKYKEEASTPALDSLTLAYHETEIMMRVVEKLQQPIFILHDCLICKRDDAIAVGSLLQQVYIDYSREMGWAPISLAYTIDIDGGDTKVVKGDVLPE